MPRSANNKPNTKSSDMTFGSFSRWLKDAMAFLATQILMLFSAISQRIKIPDAILLGTVWSNTDQTAQPCMTSKDKKSYDKIMDEIKSTQSDVNSVQQKLISQRQKDRADKFPVGSEDLRNAVSVGITLCGQFKDVGEALEDSIPVLVLAKQAPVIGAGFALLMPILEAFVTAKEVTEEIPVTLKRISRLTNALANKLRRLRKSGNRENDELKKEIQQIADLLESGIACVSTIAKKKRNAIRIFRASGDQRALETWNKEADKLLQDLGLLSAIMTYYEVVNLMDVLAFRHYVTLIPILITLVLSVMIYNKVDQVLEILTRTTGILARIATMASNALAGTANVVKQTVSNALEETTRRAPSVFEAIHKAISNSKPHV